MKLLPALGLTVVGVFLLQKVSAAAAATRINFLVGGVKLASIGFTPILNVTVVAQNPTNSTFTINSFVGNVFLNGDMIGNAAGFIPTTVKPASPGGLTGQTEIPLNVSLNGLTLVSDIVSVITGQAQVAAVVRLVGTANVDNLLLPIDITYKLI